MRRPAGSRWDPPPKNPVRPKKRLGQHFLEPAWVRKVLAAIDARADEDLLEIGPGLGALTVPLASLSHSVVAVEIDRGLAIDLSGRNLSNLTVIHGNALDQDLDKLVEGDSGRPFRVVGNLPYYVVTPIIFRVLELARVRKISDAVLMVQLEVADRLVARPGSKDYGALTVQLAIRADVERLFNLPPGAFRPVPKVSSSLVRLRFRPDPLTASNTVVFDRMLTALFSRRRKMLSNALKPFAESHGMDAAELLARLNLDARRRPETLEPRELIALADLFVST